MARYGVLLPATHRAATNIQQASFLSWHRYFTWAYENALRTECGYTGAQPVSNILCQNALYCILPCHSIGTGENTTPLQNLPSSMAVRPAWVVMEKP